MSERRGARPAVPGRADDGELVAALLTASRALVGVAARSLAVTEAEVTLQQYRALVVLAQRGELSVNAFAEALAIHPSTTTRLCDRLVAKSLVERTQSPESRREVVVALSAGGEALVASVTTRRHAEIAQIARKMTAKDRAALLRSLDAFAEAAGELPDQAWKLGWS